MERLYWGDDHSLVATAVCIAALGDGLAFDRSCFYVGGGGQPPDEGSVEFAGEKPLRVTALRVAEGVVWHVVAEAVSPAWVGRAATLRVDGGRREALSRYHTVLHVLNTIAQRDHGAWIAGAQIATDYARID